MLSTRAAACGLAAICLLLQSAPGRAENAATPQALTLADAYALAVEQSETLQIGASEWRAAEARIKGVALRQDTGPGSVRDDHEYGVGAGATWTIFNGFRTLREAEALRFEGRAVQFDNARARQLLFEGVADVFYQTLAYEGELASLARQAEALGERIGELQERLQPGRSRRAELLSARGQLAGVRLSTEERKGLREAALELPAFLVGRPAASLRPVDNTDLPQREAVDRYLAAASTRPDVEAAVALRMRWVVLAVAAILFGLSLELGETLRREFVPPQDQNFIRMGIQTPVGSSMTFTDAKAREIEAYLKGRPEVLRYFAVVGGFSGVAGTRWGQRVPPCAAKPPR